MPTIRLFLQFEGDPRTVLTKLVDTAPVRDIIAAAVSAGMPAERAEGAHVFLHDKETPLDPAATLAATGLKDKDRVHVHRCTKLAVTLHFNDVTNKYEHPPVLAVEKVKREFVKDIKMPATDATEHVLQLCGSSERPAPDVQIGSLATDCTLCFDLVPIKRIEG